MSAVAIMRALLTTWAPLTTLIPASRIIAGTLPVGTVLPAVSIMEVGGDELGTVARAGPTTTNRMRVQVTAVAKSYATQKAVMAATKLGAGVHGGTVAGFRVKAVEPAGTGPDLNDLDDDGIYEQSRDFIVTFVEPN